MTRTNASSAILIRVNSRNDIDSSGTINSRDALNSVNKETVRMMAIATAVKPSSAEISPTIGKISTAGMITMARVPQQKQ